MLNLRIFDYRQKFSKVRSFKQNALLAVYKSFNIFENKLLAFIAAQDIQ